MSSIEIELWNIYTYYTLHGNPRDPAHILGSQFIRMCKDCSLTKAAMTETPLTQPEIHLIYHAQLRKTAKNGRLSTADKITFPEFLTCLLRVAERVYPSSLTPDDALQQLLMENVLPLASRRKPDDIDVYLNSPEIKSLLVYFQDALLELFRYYATASDTNTSKRASEQTGSALNSPSPDNGRTDLNSTKSQLSNRLSNAVSYSEYLRLVHDFGLLVSLGLTIIDIGDVYLSTIASSGTTATMKKLTFSDFWACLVRLAIAIPGDCSVPVPSKVKGLFLFMWRHNQNSIPEVMNGRVKGTGQSTYKGGLLRCSQLLNEKFILQWQQDGFQDYFALPVMEKEPMAMDVLRRLAQPSGCDTTKEQENVVTDGECIIELDIADDADLGDSKISARRLKQLLKLRPELAAVLWACMREEGLANETSSETANS